MTLCSNLVRSLTSLAFFRSRIFAIILACWEFDSHLCLSFLQFLAVPFSPLLCISSLSLNLCIMHADLSSSLCWVSSILWFCHLLMCPYTDPPPTINIDDCDIPVFCTLMINGWPVRVCTTPYWMVGGWFVHYGVSVLMCAVFGDFYRMPNLELWVFPFLAHYLGSVSLASMANKCFTALWPILFLWRPEPVPYIALICDCFSLFLRQLARGETHRCCFIFHLVIFCWSLFTSHLVLEPV